MNLFDLISQIEALLLEIDFESLSEFSLLA